MAANNVIMNTNDYQKFSDFHYSNGTDRVTLSSVEIEYKSNNSSSLLYTKPSYPLEMEISSPSTSSLCPTTSYNPFLTIEEELKEQLRFRYKSENGNHGGLKPVVKLHNCESAANIWIKATLYTLGNDPTIHVFELDTTAKAKTQCENGACWLKLPNNFTARFPSLSICKKKKDEIAAVLKERTKQKYKEQKKRTNELVIEKEVQEKMKTYNLTSGRLCFEAFYNRDESLPVCEKIFSNPIYNQKCKLGEELKITRLSSFSGKTSGEEDMILLCEKIQKDDIEIIFSYQNENINWEEKAQFNPADVHHQVAIPFKTPRFIENREQEVFIRLHRKSDGKDGEARKFFYYPCDDFEEKPLKRKRPNPTDDVSMSQFLSQSEPSTSASSSENIFKSLNFPEGDILSFMNKYFDLNEWPLDFDLLGSPVTPEGILNLSSLIISEKSSVEKRKVDGEHKVDHMSCNEEKKDYIHMLKNDVISLLKERGNKTFMKILPTLLSLKDESGNSLLHLVVIEKSENLPLLIRMIEAAPNGLINQTNKMQMTPLHVAVSRGFWKVVRILLMLGADSNIKDRNGNTCTHLAAMYNLPWCLGEVLAPFLGDKKRKYLPAVNILNYEGLAPLHLSVKNDARICVKLLIQAKANLNISDGKCGKAPLHFAYEKNTELVDLLLSQPYVDPNKADFTGNIPSSCVTKVHQNSTFVPKPTECCIELSTESSSSNEDCCMENKEEKSNIVEKNNIKEENLDENSEDLFCKALDSNGLWKKLGLYIMDEKELNVIELMDSTPTKTILNGIKKQHGKKYPEKMKYILSDSELKEFAQLLTV